jgi:hypothetical protein
VNILSALVVARTVLMIYPVKDAFPSFSLYTISLPLPMGFLPGGAWVDRS